jgi:hypothetical protein
MLVGFFTTFYWLPRNEYTFDPQTRINKVKTLEQWEVGRDSGTFSATRLARFIAAVYHHFAKVWDVVYMWLDGISGGEVAQRRQYQATIAARVAAQNTAEAMEGDARRREEEEVRQLEAVEEAEARERGEAEIRRLDAQAAGGAPRRRAYLDEDVGPCDEVG